MAHYLILVRYSSSSPFFTSEHNFSGQLKNSELLSGGFSSAVINKVKVFSPLTSPWNTIHGRVVNPTFPPKGIQLADLLYQRCLSPTGIITEQSIIKLYKQITIFIASVHTTPKLHWNLVYTLHRINHLKPLLPNTKQLHRSHCGKPQSLSIAKD